MSNVVNDETLGLPSKFERTVVKEIIDKERITNDHTTVKSGSKKGDNYIGTLFRVQSHGIRNGKNVDLNLIYKIAPTGQAQRSDGLMISLFEREFFAYEEVQPELEKLQRNFPRIDTVLFAKCYKTVRDPEHEAIVLEDMSPYNFIMASRFKSLDWAHAELVLTTLAKLHALSYVLKVREPKKFESFSKRSPDVFFTNKDKTNSFICENGLLDSCYKKAIRAMRDPILTKKLGALEHIQIDMQKDIFDPTAANDTYVICHGDTWTNNYLFKYSENGDPLELCLIDWQLMRYASPLTDIMYMMWTSTDGQFRQKYYHRSFEHYHDSLATHLRYFGMRVEDIYPKRKFMEDRRKYAPFGLFWGCLLTTVMTAGAGDSSAVSIEEINASFFEDMSNELYLQRVNELARDFENYGYL